MRDYVHEHFARFPAGGRVRPMIVCADGVSYSVQASEGHYCHPKDRVGPWTSVEVYGSRRDGRDITEWPEAFVPIDKINRRIAAHGGPVCDNEEN